MVAGVAAAQHTPQSGSPGGAAMSASAPSLVSSPMRQQRQGSAEQTAYVSRWGIDGLRVRATDAGALIRFSYMVVDAERAKALNDKRTTPAMICQRARVVLQVPVADQGAPQRQPAPPEAGREFAIEFSNKGNFVKPGDRVDILIGSFHADSLVVE